MGLTAPCRVHSAWALSEGPARAVAVGTSGISHGQAEMDPCMQGHAQGGVQRGKHSFHFPTI